MYTLIKGIYSIVDQSPDADSVKFKADDPTLWQLIAPEYAARLQQNMAKEDGYVVIRLEGIDALETHYVPPSVPMPQSLKLKAKFSRVKSPTKGEHRQLIDFSRHSTSEFLKLLGVTDVRWKRNRSNTWIDSATITQNAVSRTVNKRYDDALRGNLVVRGVEKNGRPVAWVFPGEVDLPDGTAFEPDAFAAMIPGSANYQLLRQGLVYPYFFMNLPRVLRIEMAKAAEAAQAEASGMDTGADVFNIWAHDHTNNNIEIPSLALLHKQYVIFPYLFRQIVDLWYRKTVERYWDAVRNDLTDFTSEDLTLDMDGFFDHANPWVYVVSEQRRVQLDQILEVSKTNLRLSIVPQDLVFQL